MNKPWHSAGNSLVDNTSYIEKCNQMKKLLVVKSDIIRQLKQNKNKDWQTFHLTIEAPPFTNKGFTCTPVFLDRAGNKIIITWSGDNEFNEHVYDLIYQMNRKEIRNQVIFFTNRNDYEHASIFTSYSQNIEDAFQSRLPESMRGKTVAWYKQKSN